MITAVWHPRLRAVDEMESVEVCNISTGLEVALRDCHRARNETWLHSPRSYQSFHVKRMMKELNSDCILSRSSNGNHDRCTALEVYKPAHLLVTIHSPYRKAHNPP